jgi:hypothetical protein
MPSCGEIWKQMMWLSQLGAEMQAPRGGGKTASPSALPAANVIGDLPSAFAKIELRFE